jgi:hypothetical protein
VPIGASDAVDCFESENAVVLFMRVFPYRFGANFVSRVDLPVEPGEQPTQDRFEIIRKDSIKDKEMTASKLLTAIAVALAAISGGAHAETYDGVHTVNSVASRSEVNVEAVVAARSANPYATGADAGVQTVASTADRSSVHAEAVAKAHDPLQSLDRRAFYRDQVPAAYSKPRVSTRQAAL